LNRGAEGREYTAEERGFTDRVDGYRDRFVQVMDDDFNTADAIAVIFELIRECNSFLKEGIHKQVAKKAYDVLMELCGVLNILEDKEQVVDEDIRRLIEERQKARAERNWALADKIRDQLRDMGIILEDTPSGVRWKRV